MSYPLHGPQKYRRAQATTVDVYRLHREEYCDIMHFPGEVRDATVTFSRC